MDKLAQPGYIRQDGDDGDVTTPRRGQQPHHHRVEPAGENALQDGRARRDRSRFGSDFGEGALNIGWDDVRMGQGPDAEVRTGQVSGENDDPKAERSDAVAISRYASNGITAVR